MQKVFFIFTEMEKVSNWCDVLSRNLQRPTYWRRECYVDESCLALWEGFREEFRNPPEYEIREYRECVWYYSSIWYMNSLKKFWMWNAWDIHHHHERDQCWQMMRRSSGRRQEYLSTLILFYVLVRWKKVQEQQKQWKGKLEDTKMYSPYQDAVGIDGEAFELEWRKFQDFSRLSILQEIQKDLIQKNIQPKEPTHLRVNVQRHPVEIRWSELHLKRWESQRLREAVPSRTLDVSWSRLRDDMVRRFSRTTTQRNKTPYFHRHQCLESMSSQTKTKQKYHSLQ